jgi:hexosaminidase
MTVHSDLTRLSRSFQFRLLTNPTPESLLPAAFARYEQIMARSSSNIDHITVPEVMGCDVSVVSSSEELNATTNESYSLHVAAPRATLKAPTVFGVLRGLETLAQLVPLDSTLLNHTEVEDEPRFPFRATMLDTSRHFIPVRLILVHLDAMAAAKMNVLHWHIVDSVAFPYESVAFPSLSATGAYSKHHVYTQADVKRVVEEARLRGIRVIPEFDTPGHAWKGYASIPDLLTDCIADGRKYGTGNIDPTRESTWSFLRELYAELRAVFAPEKMVFIGGDEVDPTCWATNPAVQTWLQSHPDVGSAANLSRYYNSRLIAQLKAADTSVMAWQEVVLDTLQLPPVQRADKGVLVDVWYSPWWWCPGESTALIVLLAMSSDFLHR